MTRSAVAAVAATSQELAAEALEQGLVDGQGAVFPQKTLVDVVAGLGPVVNHAAAAG